MKNIFNLIKSASYDMDSFLDEVFSEKIETTKNESSGSVNFDRDSGLTWNYSTDMPDEYSKDSGIESTSAIAVGLGKIQCPKSFIGSNRMEDLEKAIDSALADAPEIYMEGASGLWGDISSGLNDLDEIHSADLEDSSCTVEIVGIMPVGDSEASIVIHVSAEAEWQGDMHEPNPPEDW